MIEELQAISSALDFAKADRVTIIDASNTARLAAYITRNGGRVSRPLRAHWRAMAEFITVEEAKRAIRVGDVPVEWKREFERAIGEFVRGDFRRAQMNVLSEVGEATARRVNSLPRKEFVFGATRERVLKYVEEYGGKLITRLVEIQVLAAKVALLQYIVTEALTPYELAKRLRHFIGLTDRYAQAVLRLERGLVAEGLAKDVIGRQVEKYATFLHKVRAENIARTELGNAYNRGQLEAIFQAREDGWIVGEVWKIWVTTGQSGRVCPDCEALDGEAVRLEEQFSAGVDAPLLHPQCGCSLAYETRR